MEGDQEEYFRSYADLDVHRLMLNDHTRNERYRKAIFDNIDEFRGATVLDVGAGTGILSVFCAQAGAAKVYAVEQSDTYLIAQDIVKENKFENIIEVIHDCIENLTELPSGEKVDIIISEWMGFYLLHEGMLDSVIYARDNFLKEGGLLFPEYAMIYSAPCSVPDMYERWDDVHGISMASFANKLRELSSQKPETLSVKSEQLLTNPEEFVWLDLREVALEDVSALKNSQLTVAKKSGKYQGVCIWFNCTFPGEKNEPVVLSTEPGEPETHWKQTTVVLPNEISVEEGEPIFYEVVMKKDASNTRRYNIELTMLDPEKTEHPECCTCHMTKCILVQAMLKKYERESMET